ncbi:aminotransferase class I/II-fold pyridoxal phosphate-dependent enzyme [Conexibacter sp. DBS9H8]|uniref:aminotransferase class I/II-fold pyridoxal phosphate-dependent enzyme n=1 Tax=Conexibacter sp. DBS9H8 TaxID=2937801 RepID=UPI0020102136|nr:aminotransferase class I/II-fold pyridoxal phosphate-dependent enzyme [Conexibacter sp. DBS9H8]
MSGSDDLRARVRATRSAGDSDDLRTLRVHGDAHVRPGDADHAVTVLAGGPPTWLGAALAEVDLTRYPNPSAAVAAVAAWHGRDPAEVVITNGAAEALWLLGPALAPHHAVLLQPGFTETEVALRTHGIPVQRCYESQEIPDRADLVVVTNPSSPDGGLRDPTVIERLRAPGRTVVVDEAFMSMIPDEPGSLAAASRKDVIVIRSLTKILSVPGLRVGYALAPPPLATALTAVQPPWSANAFALAALIAAAAHREDLAARAQRAATERADLVRALAAVDQVTVSPSATNFVLIEVPDGPRLLAGLAARRIAVRPAGSFPGYGPHHLRLTARDPAANARLVAAIRETL